MAKRNQRIQNEQRQFQNIVNRIQQANEAKEAFAEVSNPVRPDGMPHFLPLTGSETHDSFNDRDVWVGGASSPQSWKINKG